MTISISFAWKAKYIKLIPYHNVILTTFQY